MRVTFASLDGLRMCLKIGLQNVAKIARNNDIFRAIDERKYDAVQAPARRIASFAPFFRNFSPEAGIATIIHLWRERIGAPILSAIQFYINRRPLGLTHKPGEYPALSFLDRFRQRNGNQTPGALVLPVGGALIGLTIVIAGLVIDMRSSIVAGLAMIVPVLFSLHLLRERNRNIAQLKAREEKLLELSRRFDLAMETANIGIWEIDEVDDVLSWDARAAALHGFAAAEGCNRIAHWYKIIHPEDAEGVEAAFTERLHGGSTESWDISYRITLSDGTTRHLRSVGAHSNGENGPTRLTGIVWDVTNDTLFTQALREAKATSDIKNAELELALDELSSREHELSELSHKLDLALASYNCGIWEGDPVTTTAIWDDRMHQLYNVPNRNRPVTRHEWLSSIHQDDRQPVQLATNRAIASGTTVNTTQRIVLPNNEMRYVRSVGQVHVGKDGKKKIIGIAFDVTADALLAEQLRAAKSDADSRNLELELAKNRIEFNALHDPLTALANRRKLDMELDELSQSGQHHRTRFTILHLDLDRFKEINDTLGHAAGDAMLVHASRVLSRNVPRGDLVARIGGDEFVILARRAVPAAEISELCERIIVEMNKPIDFEGFSCRCGISIGIAQASGISPDARRILVNADIALYQAKEKGRNGYEFFTPDLQANIVSKKRMADEILTGLERDEFTVWYQPQFETSTMQLSGAEALVRWNHPDKGVIASNHFIKVAEELNVMARIDQLVLEKALRDQMRWTALGVKVPRISVNVSSKRLHDATLVDQLHGLAIDPGAICFELVESIFLDESDDVVTENIEKIKALGIDIEIDDFGTGHTSILSLLRLKPKRLKIDRQLVMPIVNSPQERALVRSIIEIARSLGVETVAEGVESLDHAGLLRQLGCDFLQGYAFAKPLPFDEFSRFTKGFPQRKAS
ncbi:MAG: diguanylate cyclase [Rhizobium sp.]|nr:MAG: diguanylate cyclase [Rhizobium sp.]